MAAKRRSDLVVQLARSGLAEFQRNFEETRAREAAEAAVAWNERIARDNYYRPRVDKLRDARKEILEFGLPVVMAVVWIGSKKDPLLTLEITPLQGFQHLVLAEYLPSCIKTHGMYHVSIAFKSEIKAAKQAIDGNGPRVIADALKAVYDRWDGFVGTIRIYKLEGVCADMGGDVYADTNLHLLRIRSRYECRGLHISM